MSTGSMTDNYPEFEAHVLEDGHSFLVGRLPGELCPDGVGFEVLWNLHPKDFDDFKMMGKLTKLPRWQQAYGKDYYFSGRISEARPIPPVLDPILRWSRERIDDRLNGLLLNWYDGELGHYIGPHNDEIIGPGARGPDRDRFPRRGADLSPDSSRAEVKRDFLAEAGTVFIMPYDTNRAWKHSVPKCARYRGRRISITLRAFGS